jgi:hypothetical protein
MKVHDLKDNDGRIYAFEVSNGLLGRKSAIKIVEAIPGVQISRRPHLFDGEEEFGEFKLGGVIFKIWEPFGDNSRYWIGPEPPIWCEQVSIVREAFIQHKPLGLPV